MKIGSVFLVVLLFASCLHKPMLRKITLINNVGTFEIALPVELSCFKTTHHLSDYVEGDRVAFHYCNKNALLLLSDTTNEYVQVVDQPDDVLLFSVSQFLHATADSFSITPAVVEQMASKIKQENTKLQILSSGIIVTKQRFKIGYFVSRNALDGNKYMTQLTAIMFVDNNELDLSFTQIGSGDVAMCNDVLTCLESIKID